MQQESSRSGSRRSRETTAEAASDDTPLSETPEDVEALAGSTLEWARDFGVMGASLGVLPLGLALFGVLSFGTALAWVAGLFGLFALIGGLLRRAMVRTRSWGILRQTGLAIGITSLVFLVVSAPWSIRSVPWLLEQGNPQDVVQLLLVSWVLVSVQTGALIGPLWIPYAATRVTRTPRTPLLVFGPWLWIGVIVAASLLFGV